VCFSKVTLSYALLYTSWTAAISMEPVSQRLAVCEPDRVLNLAGFRATLSSVLRMLATKG
jgi:hypothetical protein